MGQGFRVVCGVERFDADAVRRLPVERGDVAIGGGFGGGAKPCFIVCSGGLRYLGHRNWVLKMKGFPDGGNSIIHNYEFKIPF